MKNARRLLLSTFLLLCLVSAWAQTEISVVRGNEDYPPFEMTVDGKLMGLHVDMVNAAAARIGAKVNWESLPWKRALWMVETGKADGVTYIGRTPEREAWAIFSEDNLLSSAEIDFIVLKDNADKIVFDGSLSRFLEHRTPIVVRGFMFGVPEIDKIKKLEGSNMSDMVGMLKAKDADVAVVNWNDFAGAFKDKPELKEVAPLAPPVKKIRNYIAFSIARKDETLAKRFGEAMAAYKKSPAYAELLKHYNVVQ